VIVASVAGATMLRARSQGPQPRTASDVNFATVRRSDLVAVTTLDGEVASMEGPTIAGRVGGTITSMADEGTKIGRGQTLYEVDGEPVVLMYGSTPAWRDIGGNITGVDVKQLEENLEALGFETGTVDETFTSTTQSAVRKWQDSIGLTEDGVVHLGRVVFAPSALTVSTHKLDVGAATQPGQDVMSTVSSEKIVKVTLGDSSELAAGDDVSIVLPGGTRVEGKVESIDEADPSAAPGDGGSSTATVVPKDDDALGDSEDGSDVDVELVTDERRDVLVVPVTALLARQNGGYAVEVDRGNGSTELVVVRPGLYADDLVEISGNVEEGDRVVVP
jgi:peptidoglycan hydrolase-like protein with peptidoglycan-binding domain